MSGDGMHTETPETHPMSLFESGESDGSVSLSDLFGEKDFDGCESPLSIGGLISAVCRGGFPESMSETTPGSKPTATEDLFHRICHADISNIDGVQRDPNVAERILRSYARNLCTPAGRNMISADVNSEGTVSLPTVDSYIGALKRLSVIEDIPAWRPPIRSRTAIRAAPKRNLVDPSIAVAAMGLGPEYFNTDFRTLGFLFECLCIRDLKVYSSRLGVPYHITVTGTVWRRTRYSI